MSNALELVTRYTSQFDDSATNGLARLNERYRRMVVDAHWLQKEASLGVTAVGTAEYAVTAGIEDIEALYVDETRYVPVSMTDIRAIEDPNDDAYTSRPVFAQDYDSAGAVFVRLYPVPDTAGVAITVLSSGQPTALTNTSDAAGTPSIPTDLHQYLYDGLAADGYLFVDERTDMAAVHEARFEGAIVLLKRRKNSRFGSGPSSLSVSVAGR